MIKLKFAGIALIGLTGQDRTNPHPQIFVATASDCGNTSSQPRIEA